MASLKQRAAAPGATSRRRLTLRSGNGRWRTCPSGPELHLERKARKRPNESDDRKDRGRSRLPSKQPRLLYAAQSGDGSAS
jgi:hypothetical protein